MSLWSECIRERQGHEVIEEPWGFIEYHMAPPYCVIDDLYVIPEERLKGLGRDLADRVTQIARDAGATHLWSNIYGNSLNKNETLKANLAYGFLWQGIDGGRIILTKDIGGSNG